MSDIRFASERRFRTIGWFFLLSILVLAPRALAQTTTGNITGKVSDKDGKPLHNFRVWAKDGIGILTPGVETDNGIFLVTQLQAGYYKIVAKRIGESPSVTLPPMFIKPGETSTVRDPHIRLGLTWLTVRVEDVSHNPVSEAEVSLSCRSQKYQPLPIDAPLPTTRGIYVFAYLPDQGVKCTLSVYKQGHRTTCPDIDINFRRQANVGRRVTLDQAGNSCQEISKLGLGGEVIGLFGHRLQRQAVDNPSLFLLSYARAENGLFSRFQDARFAEGSPEFKQEKKLGESGKVAPVTVIGYAIDSANKSDLSDPSKDIAGLPNVQIKFTSQKGTFKTLTDRQGYYSFSNIPPGSYTIEASKQDFRPLSIEFEIKPNPEGIVTLQVALSRDNAHDSTLLQESNQVAEQTAPLVLFNATDASRIGNFNDQQIQALPLGSTTDMRTFDELALLIPGVAAPPYVPGARGPGIGFGIGTAGEFSVNGMRARSNNFSVDGSDNNDADVGVRRQGFVALVPQSLESIRAFEISTLLWDAELGHNFGSQVNAVSKSGESQYHAQAYLYFTDSRLNARSFFDYTGGASGGKDPFTRAQEGFTLGGPLLGTRIQFFTSFEHLNINALTEQHFSTPTTEERRFLGLPRFIVNVPQSAQPFYNRFKQFGVTSGATPLGQTILSIYPLPNNPIGPYGANTYTEILPANGEGSVLSGKVTSQLPKGLMLNARYNFTNDNRVLPSINRAIRSTVGSNAQSQNLSLILSGQVRPTISVQSRFSYGRTRLGFAEYPSSPFIFSASSDHSIETPIGTQPVSSSTGPIGELVIEPFSPVGVDAYSFPQGRVSNTFQSAGVVSWVITSHSLKFGADVRRVQLNSFQDRLYRPLVVYGNGFISGLPGSKKLDFLAQGVQMAALGVPSEILQTLTLQTPDSHIGLRANEFNLFLNDNWRIRRNLTLDYGLRYELNPVPREVNNRIEDALTLKDLPASGASFENPDRIKAFNVAIEAYKELLAGRGTIFKTNHGNFGPHVGLVWANARTAVRSGYGIYYDKILGAVVNQSRNIFPNEIPLDILPRFESFFNFFNLNNPSFVVFGKHTNLIKAGTLNQFGGGKEDFTGLIGELFVAEQVFGGESSSLAFTLPEKIFRTPYAQQWHLTVEHEIAHDYLVSAAYVGTKGTRLLRLTTPNLGPNLTPNISRVTNTFSPVLTFDPTLLLERNPRPDPRIGAYQVFSTSASSSYHALQIELRKRYAHRWSLTASYTWSHAIDDVSDVFPLGGAPILPQNSFDLRSERASANFDVRQRFSASMLWDLFQGHTKGIWRWLGGWRAASIFQANTGQPFTLNLPIDANLDGNLTDRPSTTQGLIFIQGHGPNRVSTTLPVSDFFVPGQNGVGRNTARGDSLIDWDISLNKAFRITERQNLDFRADFFNALNRANFGLPIRVIGTPGFGSSVDTVAPARTIQFALKYSF